MSSPMRAVTALVSALVTILATLLIPITIGGSAKTGAAHVASRTSQCDVVVRRAPSRAAARLCLPVPMTTTITTTCTARPLHVVVIVWQNLTPMGRPELAKLTKLFLQKVSLPAHPNIKVAVVWFDADSAIVRQPLTNRETEVSAALAPPLGMDGKGCFSCAFSRALSALGAGRSEEPRLKLVLYLGGWPFEIVGRDFEKDDWIKGTGQVKGAGATMMVACPWPISCRNAGTGFPWQNYASPGYYVDGGRVQELGKIMGDVVSRSLSQSSGLQVDEKIPSELAYVPDSAQPKPSVSDATTGHLRWDFTPPITRTITLTYRVKPLRLAIIPITGGQVVITDTQRPQVARVIPLPTTAITVSDACLPPTETPTPTIAPSATQTATSTPTSTSTQLPPTPIATRTSRPLQPVYLPLLLGEDCTPTQRRMDVAVVIDTSSSMLEPTAVGRTKLDAARSAAGVFLDQLHLTAGDQAALVTFDASARVAQQLTTDRSALDAALATMTTGHQTCLVCAVDVADVELASPRHTATNTPVLVLLTDGRANPQPASAAVTRAQAAKERGVAVFTVGVGQDLDDAALTAIASRPDYYFRAPDAEALDAIYRTIAVTVPCPTNAFWGRR